MAEETLAYLSIAKTKASNGRQNQNGKHESFDIVDMYNEFRCWALSSQIAPELCPREAHMSCQMCGGKVLTENLKKTLFSP
jgi:hypothetical protein